MKSIGMIFDMIFLPSGILNCPYISHLCRISSITDTYVATLKYYINVATTHHIMKSSHREKFWQLEMIHKVPEQDSEVETKSMTITDLCNARIFVWWMTESPSSDPWLSQVFNTPAQMLHRTNPYF